MKTGHVAIAMVLAVASLLRAQAPAARPAFEVAAIKRNVSLGANGGGGFAPGPGGRFRITNVDTRTLVRIAYRSGPMLFSSQVIGGPAWMDTESYDITAKVGAELEGKTQAEFIRVQPLLIQALLEDRFKLKAHRETRELQRYALVLAKNDGSPGPQLRRSSLDCSVDFTKCSPRAGAGTFSSGSTPIAALVNYLASAVVQRVVVDRTGLDGRYEIALEWTPDRALLTLKGDAPLPSSPDKPSIFTALQDQLGLKLEPERGPVDVVIIDHVERPTED